MMCKSTATHSKHLVQAPAKFKLSDMPMRLPTLFTRSFLDVGLGCVCVALMLAAPLAARADDYSEVTRLMRAGQLPDAMAKAEQYLMTKPRDPQMRFIKGVVQTEAGKTSDAIATFTQITQDYPELPEPYNNLAVLYAGQSQFDKARGLLDMAVRINPSYATAHENLGDVHARLANQAYEKALQLGGSNSTVQPKLALIRSLFSVESKASPKPLMPTPMASKPAAKPALVVPAPATVKPASAAAATVKPVPAGVSSMAESTVPVAAALGSESKVVKAAVQVWETDRHARTTEKSNIAAKLSSVVVQDHSADVPDVSSRKLLDLAESGEQRVIVKDSTGG